VAEASFLEHYAEELRALRGRAARFADAFPKIAGRLRLAPDTTDDPHVERLIQGFAYSAARLRQKIDDEFPELTGALLETLLPGGLAPVPAMSVVAFDPVPGLGHAQLVPRGSTLEAGPVEGEPIRFRTAQDVTLAPLRLASARIMNRPFEAPPPPRADAAGCLRLTLAPSGKTRLNEARVERLRLFLAAPLRDAEALMALLLQGVQGVALAAHPQDEAPRRLPGTVVTQAGFAREESLIPVPPGGLDGHRVLIERFALPEKFLFIDVETGPLPHPDRVDLYVYLSRAPGELERRVDASSFALHSTPIVNLFPARAEPVAIDGTRPDHPLTVDSRRPLAKRVHSVSEVTLTEAGGPARVARPYFHRLTERGARGVFHQLRRHPASPGEPAGEVSIAFVDGRGAGARARETTATVDVLATNGALPLALPFGGGQPRLTVSSAVEGVAEVRCLVPVTAPRRPDTGQGREWRLLSHLALNHLSLTEEGAAALKGILRLHDPGDDREVARTIDAVADVATQPAIARIRGVTVSGVDVRIAFDPGRIEEGRAVVFGSVLDRFLGLHATVNTFTRLTLRMEGRTDDLAAFPARAGEGALS
jgi:type VI secretion system protein ImpG